MSDTPSRRARLRQLGIGIGALETGAENAISDVPGVLVGHATVIRDHPVPVRTGITMIVPRAGEIWTDYAYAGSHVLNGNGEMTGLTWVEESGMLGSPVGITSTAQVGLVRDSLVKESYRLGVFEGFHLPVVGETWDGWLSTAESFPLTDAEVAESLGSAAAGPVAEGSVGGGTGMICHEFKSGIGTSSRLVEGGGERHTVGVLVQANYGKRDWLRVDGVPVGAEIPTAEIPSPYDAVRRPGASSPPPGSGSIIVVVATDAPLLPHQCERLAQRAGLGVARAGGTGGHTSGDLFIAFATGNRLPTEADEHRPATLPYDVRAVGDGVIDALFDGVIEATEEAIVNALVAATTVVGRDGITAHAIPHNRLTEVMRAAGR